MRDLLPLAEQAGTLLKARQETVAIAESSAGGLISAALLAQPGASAYFLGGAVVYTYASREVFLALPQGALSGLRPATAAYAKVLARGVCQRLGATWGLAETGATGPTGNRYGDPPGHACLALAGPVDCSIALETGRIDRLDNMRAFAAAGLRLLVQHLARERA